MVGAWMCLKTGDVVLGGSVSGNGGGGDISESAYMTMTQNAHEKTHNTRKTTTYLIADAFADCSRFAAPRAGAGAGRSQTSCR